jgi:hypothetical protein
MYCCISRGSGSGLSTPSLLIESDSMDGAAAYASCGCVSTCGWSCEVAQPIGTNLNRRTQAQYYPTVAYGPVKSQKTAHRDAVYDI